MKLLLIAGHGAGDPGAIGNGYQEATETRKVVAALSNALDGCCDVGTYPTSRNAYSDYQAGSLNQTAQFSQYDAVLELHFNASAAGAADGKYKGVEAYVTTTETDTALASALCGALETLGFPNRGVKRKNWSVISTARRQGVPAVLLEVCFIDDPDDMRLYEGRFMEVVQAIAGGIISACNLNREDDNGMSYEQFLEYQKRYEAEKAAQQPDQWSAAARAWAERNGVVNGNDAGQKRYKAAVTREEVTQMLYNAVGEK